MKLIITLFLFFNSCMAVGQGFNYPVCQSTGNLLSDFVPQGWIISNSATGDLNNDHLDDYAIVLQHIDKVTIYTNEDGYPDSSITQPRILLLLFYNASTKQYDLKQQSNTFILMHNNAAMDDPFDDISVSNNVLQINFHVFYNMGSYYMSRNIYKFRYQHNEFELIGVDYNSANRASGDTEDCSYNFLTKKVKVSTGNFSQDKKKVSWHTLSLPVLQNLKTFTQPFTWEVEPGIYL